MNISQSKVFCIFFLLGLFINLIFDIFRGVRKCFKFANIVVFLQDIIFLGISGFLFFRTLLIFNNGEIRFFMLIALVLGICIYSLTISKQCVIIVSVIVKVCKNIVVFIFKTIFLPYTVIKKQFYKFKEKNQGKFTKNIEYIK